MGEKQFLVLGSRGGQNSPLMHVPPFAAVSEVTNKACYFVRIIFHEISYLIFDEN